MLASNNLGTNYKQSSTQNSTHFSDLNGWTAGEDIDIQLYEGDAKTYVNNYVSYLQGETGDTSLSGTLITLGELESLGCVINTGSGTCADSRHASWLANGQVYWVATSYSDTFVWFVVSRNNVTNDPYDTMYGGGIRPVITISKSVL